MRFTSAAFVLVVTSLCARAQTPTWEVELLGPAPPELTLVAVVAVNDSGVVVGNGYESGWKRAWVADSIKGVEMLPLLPGASWAEVNDLNSSGVAVGSNLVGGASRAVVWTPGPSGYQVASLPDFGAFPPFDAQGVNDAGEVVGKLGPLTGSYSWTAAGGIVQIPSATFPKTPVDVNEQRQIAAGSYRMDLDDLVLENLGNPSDTTFGFMFTELLALNDAGECVGYSVVATSGPPYMPVRVSDGPAGLVWKLFATFPWTSGSALSISAAGDTVWQLGASFGTWVHVDGSGSLTLQGTLDPASPWDLTSSFVPAISRGGLLACTGTNTSTGDGGIVLLTPVGFENLGGASRGALGDPVLSAYGPPAPASPTRLRLASAAPTSTAIVGWSSTSTPIPLFGGVVHANPADFHVSLPTDALGRFDVTFNWPPVAPGTPFWLQAGVIDPAATAGVSISNALKGVTQ